MNVAAGATNPAAAEHLLTGYRARLWALARRHCRSREDAEDALARTVELALRSCPIADDMDQVEAWANVVCRREAWKIARRRRRKPAVSLEASAEAGRRSGRRGALAICDRTEPSPEDRALDAELARELHAAIEELPASQRLAVRANGRGWRNAEIATALGRSERSVRKAVEFGRRSLREKLAA